MRLRVPSVDLILPVYNEAPQVPEVLPRVRRWLEARPSASAVFVDDGSSDGTADAIERGIHDEAAPRAAIRLERSPVNRGKGAVVRDAVLASRADLVCFTDGDLAYDLDHVDRLVDALRDADVAIGSRHLVKQEGAIPSLRRRMGGAMFNLAVRLLIGLRFRDTQAGLKGFRASAAQRIFSRSRIDDFAFDVEILHLAKLEGLRVVEIPAKVSRDHAALGTNVKLTRDPWRMLRSLWRVRRIHRAPTRPRAAAIAV